jgi:site-specific DNA-methyltransferase (adenine-specific)
MDYMDGCRDNEFDLAPVDPNWGIGASRPSKKSKYVRQKNGSKIFVADGGYDHKDWDDKPATKEYFCELMRVSKHQIIWGVNFFDMVFGKGRIVWDKMNDTSDQFDCELAYNSMNDRIDIVRYKWSGFMQGLAASKDYDTAFIQQGNKKLNEKRIHPTQKPVKLYKWLLETYATRGMRILDTHLGSGSSAIAAHYFGCDFVGCEIDKEIYDSAVERFDKHTAQLMLF